LNPLRPVARDAAAPPGRQPFTARAAVLMVLVGVFAFSAFVVLSTYAPDLKAGRDGRSHALSKSAVGFAGLVRLAEDSGVPVLVSRGKVRGPGGGLRVLTLEPGLDPDAVASTLDPDAFSGATLLVLPKWQVSPDPRRSGWVVRHGLIEEADLAPLLRPLRDRIGVTRRQGGGRATAAGEAARGLLDLGEVDTLQTISGSGWTPLLTNERGGWLLVQSASRPALFVLSDPDLLNNQGLRSPRRAGAAMTILDYLRAGGPVVFDVALNGFARSRGVLKLAFEPPFLAATLCALAAALLMGLHAAVRFGAPQTQGRALALGKTALADNSAALLRLAKREPAMAEPYADLTRQAVARAVGAPRSLNRGELDAMLDRLAVKAGHPAVASGLTAEASRVTGVAGLMTVARKLYDFRRGMSRECD